MNKETARLLEQHFDTAFAAPDGIARLRELILTLAMQGKLVEQDPNDSPALELLKEIKRERASRDGEKTRRKDQALPPIKPEEVPYELPKGWEWVRLGAICSYIQRGKGPIYVDFSTHRVISQKCVRWYGLDLEPARYIDPASLEKYELIRFLRVGDLLWNSTGTGTIGRACLVPKELEDVEIVADSHVTVVRTIEVSPLFLLRWIQTPIVQNEIEGSASGSTNQIELNTSAVINQLLPLPPLPEQHRIVARIDQLMARCDSLEKLHKEREEKRLAVHAAAIEQLLDPTLRSFAPSRDENSSTPQTFASSRLRVQNFLFSHFGELYTVKENVAKLRKAILQLAVMGCLVPQDPKDPPASELLKEIEAEKRRLVKAGKIKQPKPLPPIKSEEVPYELPQGWEWVRLGELAESIDYGTSQKTCDDSSLVPVFRMGNIVDGQLIDKGFKYISPDIDELPRLFLQPNDILFNRTNSYELVGKSARYTGPVEHASFASYLIRVRLFDALLNPVFINQAMNAPYFRSSQIEPEIVQQCGQANFNGTKLSLCAVPLPPLPEQHRIVARIDQLMAICDTLDQQIKAASGKQNELLGAVMAQV